MNIKYKLFIAALLISIYSSVNAQCKGFTKKKCLPELAPYLSNGQLISAKLTPGEDANVEINFNKGLSYRVIVCGDPYLQGLNYILSDNTGAKYASDTLKNVFSSLDLIVKQSGPLNLSLNIPKKENTTNIIRSGCVTILIGFKSN